MNRGLVVVIWCFIIFATTSCSKNYSCRCINELSMAAQHPSESYTVSASSRGEADNKCKEIEQQDTRWTSCTAYKK